MNLENHVKRDISLFLAAFAIILLCSSAVAAVDVDRIDVSVDPNSIKAGENFDVVTTFREPDENTSNAEVEIEITVDVDGEVVIHHEDRRIIDFVKGEDYKLTINSDDFKVDGDKVWNGNLMEFGCKNNIPVTVTVGGDVDAADKDDLTASDEVDIKSDGGREISSVELDPQTLTLEDTVTVTVFDEDEDPLKDANVKFTWIDDKDGDEDDKWDVSDASKTRNTDSDGQVDFKLSKDIDKTALGKHQMDVWKDGYCKVTNQYDITNALNISDPEPASPKVGEPFKVKITTASGNPPAVSLVATLSPGNIRSSVSITDGYATFTVTAVGTYTITTGGGTTGYDVVMKSIKVGTRPPLAVTVSPDPQSVNKPVIITVKSNGDPVDGATVKVMLQGGTEQTLPGTTSNSGTISFTASEAGDYTVKATKEGYDDSTETFQAKNSFQIEVPPASQIKKGGQVTVTVKDQAGNAVDGAAVSMQGTTISGTTDPNGKFTFTLEEVGALTVNVKKTGYIDGTASLSLTDKLTVKLDRKEISLDESVKITVSDSEGNPVEASVEMSGAGTSETHTTSDYTFTPKKAGDYTIGASKTGYASASESLAVKPRPLTLTYQFRESLLVLNATTNGKPAANLKVSVVVEGKTYTVTTDNAGVATMAANGTGNYTIQVSDSDYVPVTATASKGAMAGISDIWIAVLIVLVALVLIGIFVVVLISLLQRRGGANTAFKRSGRSRLGGG